MDGGPLAQTDGRVGVRVKIIDFCYQMSSRDFCKRIVEFLKRNVRIVFVRNCLLLLSND